MNKQNVRNKSFRLKKCHTSDPSNTLTEKSISFVSRLSFKLVLDCRIFRLPRETLTLIAMFSSELYNQWEGLRRKFKGEMKKSSLELHFLFRNPIKKAFYSLHIMLISLSLCHVFCLCCTIFCCHRSLKRWIYIPDDSFDFILLILFFSLSVCVCSTSIFILILPFHHSPGW